MVFIGMYSWLQVNGITNFPDSVDSYAWVDIDSCIWILLIENFLYLLLMICIHSSNGDLFLCICIALYTLEI